MPKSICVKFMGRVQRHCDCDEERRTLHNCTYTHTCTCIRIYIIIIWFEWNITFSLKFKIIIIMLMRERIFFYLLKKLYTQSIFLLACLTFTSASLIPIAILPFPYKSYTSVCYTKQSVRQPASQPSYPTHTNSIQPNHQKLQKDDELIYARLIFSN